MLNTHGLRYGIGGSTLLDSCTLAIDCGEVTALLGPNGAGKSTLLRLLAGELRPSAGAVCIDGVDIRAWGRVDLARIRAVVTQFNHVAFPFTVTEIVALGRAPHRSRDTREMRAHAIATAMTRTDIGAFAERIYASLSGGEQQRVAIARALAQIDGIERRSRYLLLDEPTANLDLYHQHRLLLLLRELADNGCAVIVVLHDINLAFTYADRVILLDAGSIVADGAVEETLTAANIARVFGVAAERLATADGAVTLAIGIPPAAPR